MYTIVNATWHPSFQICVEIHHFVRTSSLSSSLLPLPRKKRQSVILRRKCNRAPIGKEENISSLAQHLLARLILDRHASLDHNLAFVVCVCVYEGGALFEPVEAAGDGLVRVDFIAVGVLVCVQGKVEEHELTCCRRRQGRRSRLR